MGRSDSSHYAKYWAPPAYTVGEDQKIADGGHRPTGPSNWGRWGEDDQRGTANHIGPAQVLAAAGLVRRGEVFSLALPLDDTAPRFHTRPAPNHYFVATGADAIAGSPLTQAFPGHVYNDDVIEVHTHGSTQ